MELKIENGVVKGLNDKGYKGKVEIPSYVTAIDAEAFADCGEITEVELSEDLVFIGKFAFFNCKKLKTVSFGKRIKEIGRSAFQNCEALEKAELQYGIAEIEPWTFAGCKSLKEVVIPNGVKHIGHQAFVDCSSLETIDLRSIELYEDVYDEPALGYDVFQNVNPKCKIIVPLYAEEKYKEAAQWNVFDDIVVNKEKIFYHHGLRYRAFEEEEETEEKRRKIVVTDNKDFVGSANIESEIKFDDLTLTVCSIDRDAFKGNKELTSVTIPETLETIGLGAFAFCTRLEHFKCDNELGNKGNYVAEEGVLFEKTENKTMDKLVAYPAANGREAYSIPPSVTKIEDYAFSSIHSLVRIVFPNKEYDIQGTHVFDQADSHNDYLSNCWAFIPKNAVGLKKTLEELGFKLFNTDSFSEGGLNYRIISDDKEHKVEVADNKDFAGEAVIPEKVKFAGVEYTVDGIGDGAFNQNKKVTSVVLPNTLKYVGDMAFQTLEIPMALPSSLEKVGRYAFTYNVFSDLTLPSGLKEMGDSAFAYTTVKSEKAYIPASVMSIGNASFYGSGIKEINVDSNNKNYKSLNGVLYSKDGVKLIAYPNLKADRTYTVLNGVTTIGRSSFVNKNLTKLVIPTSVNQLEDAALWSCRGLKMLEVQSATPPKVGEKSFNGVPADCFIVVPKGNIGGYQSAEGWKQFASRVVDEKSFQFSVGKINYKVISLEDRTVEVAKNPDASGAIAIPNQVAYCGVSFMVVGVGDNAFSQNKKVTSVILPNTLKYVGDMAFQTLEIPMALPSSLEKVGRYAFTYNVFNDLTLPSGLKEVGDSAFAYTTVKSEKAYIPASVASMGKSSFYYSGVKELKVDVSNKYYKSTNGVLFSKDGLKLISYPRLKADQTYIIPNGVTTIGYCSFTNQNLTRLVIPTSVNQLEDAALWLCRGLKTLEVQSTTPPKVEEKSFNGVPADCLIRVPVGCAAKYTSANGWKNFINIVTGGAA